MKYHLRTVTWKFSQVRDMPPELLEKKNYTISNPEDVYTYVKPIFLDQVRERFAVLWLDGSNKVTGFEIISEGSLNASIVHPREVFRGAIVSTAASVILAHNHPSGNPNPSMENKHITRQHVESGKIIGITVHDHIIFAGESYLSFAEAGLL